MLQLVHIQIEYALAPASHGYIIRAHMNKCTSLNNVMGTWCPLSLPVTTMIFPVYNLFFLNKCVAPAPRLQCAGSKMQQTHKHSILHSHICAVVKVTTSNIGPSERNGSKFLWL